MIQFILFKYSFSDNNLIIYWKDFYLLEIKKEGKFHYPIINKELEKSFRIKLLNNLYLVYE